MLAQRYTYLLNYLLCDAHSKVRDKTQWIKLITDVPQMAMCKKL